MSPITLSAEQARLIAESASPVPLCDPSGNIVGHCSRLRTEQSDELPLLSPTELKASLPMCDESMDEAASGGGQSLEEALQQTLDQLGQRSH